MQHLQSKKRISDCAQKALIRIREEDLLPTPENFELWFVYYAKSNAGVTRAIDVLEIGKEDVTNEICHDIYDRFLSEESEAQQVHEAGDKIQKTIENVSGMVRTAKAATNQYNEDLSSAAETLGDDADKAQLQSTLKGIMDSTTDMLSHNQKLEEQLSNSMQIIIEMKQDLDAVRKEAMTDALTGLSNRKAFDEEILRCVEQVNNGDVETFSLILMDIDHFKKFNDKFGHQLGDQVLKLVSRTLVDGVKGRDTAARYGGEEFGIILPDTDISGGIRVADNLRMAVVSREITNKNTGEKIAKITLSGGVAQYIPGENTEDLIERADMALYAAKKGGRNKIVTAAGQVAQK